MILKEKLKAYLPSRKMPMTAEMIAERFGCNRTTAVKVMRQLIEEGVVTVILVAGKKKYVRAII